MSYDCPHQDDPVTCPPCQGAGAPKRLRRSAASEPRTALYDGRCPVCDGAIAAGVDTIVRDDEDAWLHADCAEGAIA